MKSTRLSCNASIFKNPTLMGCNNTSQIAYKCVGKCFNSGCCTLLHKMQQLASTNCF